MNQKLGRKRHCWGCGEMVSNAIIKERQIGNRAYASRLAREVGKTEGGTGKREEIERKIPTRIMRSCWTRMQGHGGVAKIPENQLTGTEKGEKNKTGVNHRVLLSKQSKRGGRSTCRDKSWS